ncbi:glycosyl hydrolase family 65 protein [Mycoplasma marinum]|uniref:Family 65 glycosyl hydrolase n=1 Tax=Mycoplasma marinum TaxID=1937190 RepID=A0A4R0XL54_9MOLU|nr:glycosyl hydrolase family 65 protein [Mycoplasma marinum]TCG11194.1 family 65 glycosyl hydrolase [Mycoplasma marinum]
MKKLLKYDTKELQISQIAFDKNLTAKTESMMSLGNGYLGLRSSDEEVEKFNKEDLFVNGIFNQADDQMVSELANLADLTQTPIYLDGELLSIKSSDKYTKTLCLKNATLTRELIIKREDKEFKITFERFVSQDIENVYAQRINIEQLSGESTEVIIMPRINGQTTNSGAQHCKEGQKRRTSLESVQYAEHTNQKNDLIIHNMITNVFLGETKQEGGNDDYVISMARRQVGFKIKNIVDVKTSLKLEKLMSVNTSIDEEERKMDDEKVKVKANDLFNLLKSESFESLLSKSIDKYADLKEKFHVKIKGKSEDASYDQMALAFSVLHMNSFVPKNNSNLSIGAKGLSGEGYQGHSFWDTEFFIVPNYLFSQPEIAKNLLVYRYKGIEGARAKAMETKERSEESGLEGAQFPWEMAWPTDGEVCPYWGQADVVTGKQVPIASRRQEIHVPADVAFAVDQYYDFTGDEKFMQDMGYEMIIDTAIFWANRAEKQQDGKYMIKDVMGPNEYKGNIDNNAYINAFASKNIELAFKYIDKLNESKDGKEILKTVTKKIPYEVPLEKMKDVLNNLVQQTPNSDGIIAENDQFLKLDRIDVTPFQLLGDAGKKLFNTKEGHKRLGSQLVKQADVVLLTSLMPEKYDKEIIKKNFEFYEPITTHDSSLSPTTYAVQAVDLRKMDTAYKLYKYSLDIDMGTNMKSCDAGIHAGAIAAIWQTTVYGYGGLRWRNGELHINPVLPKQWEELEYKIMYKGVEILVKVNGNKFTIETIGNNTIKLFVNNELIEINNKKEFEVQND